MAYMESHHYSTRWPIPGRAILCWRAIPYDIIYVTRTMMIKFAQGCYPGNSIAGYREEFTLLCMGIEITYGN